MPRRIDFNGHEIGIWKITIIVRLFLCPQRLRRARHSVVIARLLHDGATALEYADAITDTHREVNDDLFARMQRHYDDDTIAELTMIIAWENASSRFNRAFRIPSQGFWKP